MKKIWEWLKKNWYWLIAPVALLVLGALWLMGWRKKKDDPVSHTPDKDADQAVDDTNKAHDIKDQALKELEKSHAEKISQMSAEQKKEFEEMKKKPIDEVANWIDSL